MSTDKPAIIAAHKRLFFCVRVSFLRAPWLLLAYPALTHENRAFFYEKIHVDERESV